MVILWFFLLLLHLHIRDAVKALQEVRAGRAPQPWPRHLRGLQLQGSPFTISDIEIDHFEGDFFQKPTPTSIFWKSIRKRVVARLAFKICRIDD